MKKILSAVLLSLATLFMLSNAAFANSCNYEAKVKSNTGTQVNITSTSYIDMDDNFVIVWESEPPKPDLNNSTDVYTKSVTNNTLTCHNQKYALSLEYWCTGIDGVSRHYAKKTGEINGGHSNKAYIIINECDGELIYREDSWPLLSE